MEDAATVKWFGQSGKPYLYWLYPLGTNFGATPGNYIFTQKTEAGEYKAIYIGETDDLSQGFENHKKMPCIKEHGATHIFVHQSLDALRLRCVEESDLIANYTPPCNKVQ